MPKFRIFETSDAFGKFKKFDEAKYIDNFKKIKISTLSKGKV
jgi:hypothetical protein